MNPFYWHEGEPNNFEGNDIFYSEGCALINPDGTMNDQISKWSEYKLVRSQNPFRIGSIYFYFNILIKKLMIFKTFKIVGLYTVYIIENLISSFWNGLTSTTKI